MPDRGFIHRAEYDAHAAVDRGWRLIKEDQFVVVFVLIVCTILSNAFLGEGIQGMVITLGFLTVTMVVTLSTSDVGPIARRIGGLASLIGIIGIATAETMRFSGVARFSYMLLMVVLSVVTPVVIARRIIKHPYVSVETVAGAADIYLLIGLFFAVAYSVIGMTSAGFAETLQAAEGGRITAAPAFFLASRPVGPADFIYYSFITLTTVGYGDLTSAIPLGRMFSVAEALFGQLYLVTVVAILVANIRGRRHDADGPEVSTEEDL